MKGEWIGLRSEESSSLDRDRWILGIIETSAKVSKTLAKHADRTEFHRSRKLVAAARAGALGLRFHGLKRPFSRNLSRKQRHAPPSGAKSASIAPDGQKYLEGLRPSLRPAGDVLHA